MWWKREWAEHAQNCFLNCLLPAEAAASAIGFYIDEIEMEILPASQALEFSHSLGQNRKSSMRAYVFRFAPESGHRAMQSACPFRAITGLMHRSKLDAG